MLGVDEEPVDGVAVRIVHEVANHIADLVTHTDYTADALQLLDLSEEPLARPFDADTGELLLQGRVAG